MIVMKSLIICIIILLSNGLYAQSNEQDTILLRKVFGEVPSHAQSFYVSPINKGKKVSERLKEIILVGKIMDSRKIDSLILSKEEQKYLLNQMAQTTIWTDNLFSGFKRIDTDSAWLFLEQENKNRYATLKAAIDTALLSGDTARAAKLNQQYYTYAYMTFIFYFPKPIYIRDNTICLISYTAMCGELCGFNETSFYKKENNEWKRWIVISSGVF